MNSWGTDQFPPNMMGMPGMMPNIMPPGPLQPPSMAFPPMGDMTMNQMGSGPGNPPVNFIGPVVPDSEEDNTVVMEDAQASNGNDQAQESLPINRDRSRNDRRDRGYERDRGRRRSRSRNRDRDHNRDNHNSHNRSGRNRPSKWNKEENETQSQGMQMNMMMQGQGMATMPPMHGQQMHPGQQIHPAQQMHPGQQMHLGQQMHPGQQMYPGQMSMFNPMMGNMPTVPNPMGNMPNSMDMSNIMMENMGINMMMMNQQIQMNPNSMYFSNGSILPPLPGTSTPARREKPLGCRTIFIGGLPSGITEEVITEIFQRFGDINDVKIHRQGVCHIRFESMESVEASFALSGSRIKLNDQSETDLLTLFIDYALNREDQNEYERNKRRRGPSPPRVEPYSQTAFASVGEKIKTDTEFSEVANTLAAWLERGECNKKNANAFYHMIQASNNQLRRLFNEKMTMDDEYNTMRNTFKDKFSHILLQFEQVAKILKAAKIQRVSDHFSKQQRRNIEMWLKMTEELENMKEEFNTFFDDEETEKSGKNAVPLEKYEQLRAENDNLSYELAGYKNEAHLAKDEAERKFEKFKAHFIAQQALQNKTTYPPLPPPPMPSISPQTKPLPPVGVPPVTVSASEAKLISLVSAFLMIHPLGASLDYIVSYVKSMVPSVAQSAVHEVLKKYTDVFQCKTTGVGAFIDHKWGFVIFDTVKQE